MASSIMFRSITQFMRIGLGSWASFGLGRKFGFQVEYRSDTLYGPDLNTGQNLRGPDLNMG